MALVAGLLAASKIVGSLSSGKKGGTKVAAKKTIGKEPIWSSGTTKGGEYLSSGDRKAIFRQTRAKISSSSSLIPTSSAIVPSSEGAMTVEGMGLDTGKTLEQRVANNEKKITMLKRIVKAQQTPFGGGPLEEVNRILEDIGNALALDFSNRITQRQDEISNLREGAETKRRGGIESGLETVNKISKKVNSAFGAVVAPATGILNKILGFFGSLAAGFVADKALTWLSNNKEAVTGFFQFLQDHGKKILIALGVFIGGVIAVKVVKTIVAVAKFIKGAIFIIKKALQIARILLKMGTKALKPLGKIVTGQGLKLGGKQTSKIVAKQVTKKAIAKGATKSLLKKIPLVGLGLGAAFAIGRAAKGDWLGAGMELSSGAASMIPGAGTAASVGIDAALMYKDIKSAGNLEPPETDSSVEVMETIKQSDMSSLGGQSSRGSENSLPSTPASDISNSEISFAMEQLGIYV